MIIVLVVSSLILGTIVWAWIGSKFKEGSLDYNLWCGLAGFNITGFSALIGFIIYLVYYFSLKL